VDDFPRGEYPALREVLAGTHISRACVRQRAFHEQAAIIREARTRQPQLDTACKLAKHYAQSGSLGHLVMTHVLLAAGDETDRWASVSAEVIWSTLGLSLAVIHCDPATRPDVRRYFPGSATIARWERGAALIARRGAGLCLVPGCEAERDRAVSSGGPRAGVSRGGRQYCEAHFDPRENKPDAKIVEQTFAAAAAALPRSGDQRRALAAAQRTGR